MELELPVSAITLIKHRPLVESLNEWDVKLYAEANNIFWKRWKDFDIDPARLEARRILQAKPLVLPPQLPDGSAVRESIVSRIKFRSNNVAPNK